MSKRRLAPAAALATFALPLVALACTCGPMCGPLSQIGNLPATVGAAQATVSGAQATIDAALEEFGPTLEAGMTEMGPTLEAQLTELGPTLIAGATEFGPQVMTMEAEAIATANAQGPQGAGGNIPNTFDGGDGYTTTGGGTLAVPGSATATLNSLSEAHNWVFEGQAGQSVTIRVDGQGDTDPRAKLLDPSGNVIDEDDDGGGGWNALITALLPASGTYTIRVDMFTEGTYTVSVQ